MPAGVVPVTRAAGESARLEAENEKLRTRVTRLEAQCGHLMVDADRREERAREEAHSCAAHGREIQRLRHLSSECWAEARQQEDARRSIVSVLLLAVYRVDSGAEPLPAEVLLDFMRKAIAAHGKVRRRPLGYPTLGDCHRAGGCDHDGLSKSLDAAIAAETAGAL